MGIETLWPFALVIGCLIAFMVGLKMSRRQRAERIDNTQREGNEARQYIKIQVKLDGKDTYLLFTERELQQAEARALDHPEDTWSDR